MRDMAHTKIPAYAQKNNIGLKVTPFKGMWALSAHDVDLFGSFLSTVADQFPFLQHYPLLFSIRYEKAPQKENR
jgi:hypothetical protein